jgi:hypothetical protein
MSLKLGYAHDDRTKRGEGDENESDCNNHDRLRV